MENKGPWLHATRQLSRGQAAFPDGPGHPGTKETPLADSQKLVNALQGGEIESGIL
jgi:hypothetical protein